MDLMPFPMLLALFLTLAAGGCMGRYMKTRKWVWFAVAVALWISVFLLLFNH
jgi:hypothetical protein